MRFDVEKFERDTNNSCYYEHWNDSLKQMNERLGGGPTFLNSKHYWTFFVGGKARGAIKIGFDEKGNLFCECVKKGASMTKEQANAMVETLMKVLNVFDEFGFIINSTEKGGEHI